MSEIQVGQINSTDGSTAITTGADGYVSFAKTQIGGRRNLIINGAMQVAQRGTTGTSTGYDSVDRFSWNPSAVDQLGGQSVQSTNAPDGFSNSFGVEVTTAETAIEDTELLRVIHKIEAKNCQGLAYGSSSAKSTTLSFWVKSSVTGAFAVNMYQEDSNRIIGATYTINSANTWEYKTITFAGDTTGVINNDNGQGLSIQWGLLVGPGRKGTDNSSWGTFSITKHFNGHTAEFGTSTSHNWYITGVQLEVGTVATPFEHRSYGEELALCQRYFWYQGYLNSVPQRFANQLFSNYNSTEAYTSITFPVQMRSTPTATASAIGGFSYYSANGSRTISSLNFQNADQSRIQIRMIGSGFTEGYVGHLDANSSSYITFDAEL